MAPVTTHMQSPSSGDQPIANLVHFSETLAGCILVVNPLDEQTYSVGLVHLFPTEGATAHFRALAACKERRNRKPPRAPLCLPFTQRRACPHGARCAAIHCSAEGLAAMRLWITTTRVPTVAATGPKHHASPLESPPPPGPASAPGGAVSFPSSPSSIVSPERPSSLDTRTDEEWTVYYLQRLALRMQGIKGRDLAAVAPVPPPPSPPPPPRSPRPIKTPVTANPAVQQSIQRLRLYCESQDLPVYAFPPVAAP
jgi:hypothetical protein